MCNVLAIDPSEIKPTDRGARARIEEAGKRYARRLEDAAKLRCLELARVEAAQKAIEQEAAFKLAVVVAKYRMVEVLGASPKNVIREIAEKHGLTPAHLTGAQRTAFIAHARQEAMFEIRRRHPALSLPQIGKLFGDKDHTTVLHAIRTHAERSGQELPASNYYDRRPKWVRG
jgi:chromosomal replication initiation ATPase DnaA